jgi:nucleoside-diphosphate-sugar epimerase
MLGDAFMVERGWIADYDDTILVTGSNGFIGSKVVECLLDRGFKNLRCFVRSSNNISNLYKVINSFDGSKVEIIEGNLLSVNDCKKAAKGARIIYHLAAGIEKSFPGCFINSVVATRNLLDSILQNGMLSRFVNVSSIVVYSNAKIKRGGVLDETCEIEKMPHLRYQAYFYGKLKQDEILMEYHDKYNIPSVIMRPGVVYGPGKDQILLGIIGIDTFGIFLHLGGSNIFPLTYVDNCADAIVLAGLKKGIEGEVFNIVDDDLPTCGTFLKMYKKNVRKFKSIYIPYQLFYMFCFLWEKYSKWSEGQLPPAFNRQRCSAYWKGNQYSNQKIKSMLGWKPKISFDEAAERYFKYLNSGES